MPGPDFGAIAQARSALRAQEAALAASTAAARRARAELAAGQGRGMSAHALAELETAVEAADQTRSAQLAELGAVAGRLDAVLEPVRFSPDVQLAGQARDVPMALLPVRIETRLVEGDLLIRIYPDQIHLHRHAEEIDAAEADAGRAYWRALAQGMEPGKTWDALITAAGGAGRARFLAERLRPAPDGTEPDVAIVEEKLPARPEARLLPTAWCATVLGADGAVLLRRWSGPVDERLAMAPAGDWLETVEAIPDGAMPLDPTSRWLVDFEEATTRGMALRIKPAEFGPQGLPAVIARLVVVGSNWTLDTNSAAAALSEQLLAHSYAQGFSLPGHGTPTNRSSEQAAVPPATAPARPEIPSRDSDLGQLKVALGLPDTANGLSGSAGTERHYEATAREMHTALWGSSFGFYLGPVLEPVISPEIRGETRVHVREYLRPAGPLPIVQVGRQPYGVLPILSTPVRKGRFDGLGSYPGQLARVLGNARALAEGASLDPAAPTQLKFEDILAKLPTLHAAEGPPAAERLAEILKQGPLARAARVRPTLGPAEREATAEDTGSLANRHAAMVDLLLLYTAGFLNTSWPAALIYQLAVPGKPRFRLDAIPWVSADLSSSEPVKQALTRLRERIAEASANPAAMSRLLATAADDATTLFEGLLFLSGAYEYWEAGAAFVRDDIAIIAEQPFAATPEAAIARMASASFIGIEAAQPREHAVAVESIAQLLNLTGSRSENQPLITHLQALVSASADHPAVRDLRAFNAALETLGNRPAHEVDQALRGLLDAGSHRLDAWITSLATRRLAEFRAGNPTGLHLGCYGIVHDLVLAPGQAVSEGYMHLPSADHAATAAVLRSGHLANLDGDGEAFAIRLTSHRVRDAQAIVEGMLAGQPVSALLGYRFERWLIDDRLSAKYIERLRRLYPLPFDAEPAGGVQESLPPRDVVDGLALAQAWKTTRDQVLEKLKQPPASLLDPDPTQFLDALVDLHDAFLDLWVTEAAHQMVQGNTARMAASLATLDRQERPPEPRAIHTPRNAWSYAQRVVWAAASDRVADGWPKDVIGDTEPVANAMAADLIGRPGDLRISATVIDAAGAPVAGQARRILKLKDFNMSPLALVRAAAPTSGDGPSALEWRMLGALERLEALPAGAGLQLEDDGGKVSELLARLRAARAVLFGRPALTAQALMPPTGVVSGEADLNALQERADTLKTWIDKRAEQLKQARSIQKLSAAIAAATAIVPVPEWAVPGRPLSSSELRSLADSLHATLQGWREAWDIPGGDPADPATAERASRIAATLGVGSGAAASEKDAARIKLVLGNDFPVLAPFVLPDALSEQLHASLADQDALTGVRGVREIRRWRRAMGLVRPQLRALNLAFDAAKGLSQRARQWRIMQLPHTPGRCWASLPFTSEQPPREVQLSLMLAGDLPRSGPIAGILVDDWPEAIPERSAPTSLSFHFDAPAARPPQAILLAVDAGLGETGWSADALVDTVNEAFDLARLRLLTPERIPGHGALLPTTFLPRNLSNQMPSLDLLGIAAGSLVSSAILGKPGA